MAAYKIVVKDPYGYEERVVEVGMGCPEGARSFWLNEGKTVFVKNATNNEIIEFSAGLPVSTK
jgi:hypothetical protein